MAHWKKSFPSKYLQAADLDTPIMATVKTVVNENIGQGDAVELKPVVQWDESVKGVVLNLTRAEALATLPIRRHGRLAGTRVLLRRGTTRTRGKRWRASSLPAAAAQAAAPASPPPPSTRSRLATSSRNPARTTCPTKWSCDMAEALTVLPAVRSAYEAGLCLLPVGEDGTKAPDVPSWLTFKTTRANVDQMRAWDFGERCGFGVIAGPVSADVECWDFDVVATFDAFIETAEATGLAGPRAADSRGL